MWMASFRTRTKMIYQTCLQNSSQMCGLSEMTMRARRRAPIFLSQLITTSETTTGLPPNIKGWSQTAGENTMNNNIFYATCSLGALVASAVFLLVDKMDYAIILMLWAVYFELKRKHNEDSV